MYNEGSSHFISGYKESHRHARFKFSSLQHTPNERKYLIFTLKSEYGVAYTTCNTLEDGKSVENAVAVVLLYNKPPVLYCILQ